MYEQKLEQKTKEVLAARDANKKLEAVCQNKQLKERGQLDLELQEVQGHLQSRDQEVKVRLRELFSFGQNLIYFNIENKFGFPGALGRLQRY